MSFKRLILLATLGGVALLLGLWLVFAPQVLAQSGRGDTPTDDSPAGGVAVPGLQQTPVVNMSISDETCLECHGQPGTTMTLENGDVLDLYVPAEAHASSVHGQMGYACVQCHTTVGEYPHPAWTAANSRDVTLKLSEETCKRCHQSQYELAQDSVHAWGQTFGNRDAAVCVDCHTAHDVRRINDSASHQILQDARQWIPTTCARCHSEIYYKYEESVHGSALTEGNPDVPTCIDCHGVHNIENPTTTFFRLNSPQICAKCHTDPSIMDKYGISTNVLDTYVADFHGTTVAVFEKQSPDADVNKPVCFDCHGVHNISRVDDPQAGLQMQENILARCQVCHPDATSNFPASWMSHYNASPDRYSLVYYINMFYAFFIPVVLGGMGILVVLDANMLIRKRRAAKKAVQPSSADQPPAPVGERPVSESEANIQDDAEVKHG